MAPCTVLGLSVLDKVALRIFLTVSAETKMEYTPKGDVLERRGEANSRGARGALRVRHDQQRWPLSGEVIV